MYADFSNDRVKAFLQDLTEQPRSMEIETVAESFSDETILAEMELARFKNASENGLPFESRAEILMRLNRIHPADMQ